MQYKRRLARHIQKRIAAERAGRKVSKRTLTAIENNSRWVRHYENLINQKQQRHEGHNNTGAIDRDGHFGLSAFSPGNLTG